MHVSRLAAVVGLAAALAGCGGGGGGAPPNTLIPGWNLDFTTAYVVPPTYAAASGQAGTWVVCNLGATSSVANVTGAVTALSVTLTGFADAFNTPATDTGFLMADSVVNSTFMNPTAFSCTLAGLPAGSYDLYYYHFGATNGLTCNGVAMPALTADSSATARDVLGAQGTNWNVFRVVVAAGASVAIVDTNPADPYGLSGIQIVPVAP